MDTTGTPRKIKSPIKPTFSIYRKSIILAPAVTFKNSANSSIMFTFTYISWQIAKDFKETAITLALEEV
jgi:hypothetical protein